jgi:DNA-directed RNA polymerase specialized sigma24 family protein
MHRAWFRLGSQDKALAYLCRELIRHVRARVRGKPARASSLADMPAIAILSSLPVRQREVLVLRYFAGLSEIQIAEAVGVRPQAVTRHLSCGLAAYHDGAG